MPGRDRVDLSHELTDQDYGRPVVKALRDLANLANRQAQAIPALTDRVDALDSRTASIPQIQQALSSTGSNPVNPPSVPGGSAGSGSGAGAVHYGSHGERLAFSATADHDGALWYETDRALTYQYHHPAGWRYLAGVMAVSLSGDNPLPPGSDDGSGGTTDLPADSSDGGQTAAGVAAAGPTGHPGGAYDGTAFRAGTIIGGTATEWSTLTGVEANQTVRDAHQEELLLRILWHLQQDGYTAGRQRNPSGILSGDKITIAEDGGVLRAFDIFTVAAPGDYTQPITIQALQVSPANYVADPGTAD